MECGFWRTCCLTLPGYQQRGNAANVIETLLTLNNDESYNHDHPTKSRFRELFVSLTQPGESNNVHEWQQRSSNRKNRQKVKLKQPRHIISPVLMLSTPGLFTAEVICNKSHNVLLPSHPSITKGLPQNNIYFSDCECPEGDRE